MVNTYILHSVSWVEIVVFSITDVLQMLLFLKEGESYKTPFYASILT